MPVVLGAAVADMLTPSRKARKIDAENDEVVCGRMLLLLGGVAKTVAIILGESRGWNGCPPRDTLLAQRFTLGRYELHKWPGCVLLDGTCTERQLALAQPTINLRVPVSAARRYGVPPNWETVFPSILCVKPSCWGPVPPPFAIAASLSWAWATSAAARPQPAGARQAGGAGHRD